VQSVIGDKSELHEALDRNGLMVPPLKLCKINYLKRVFNREVWVPLYQDVRVRSCYKKPTKKEIFSALIYEANMNQFDLGIYSSKDACPAWMLLCLSTVKPNHKFFEKSFVPSKVKKQSPEKEGLDIRINPEFLKDLPMGKAKKKTVKLMGEKQKEDIQTQLYKRQLQVAQQRLDRWNVKSNPATAENSPEKH
jgi:23S rRNA G2069 N7-methylase RlmK/C1962 C5-methylase RlmI